MLAEIDGHPVAARQGNVLAAAFHPELTDDPPPARAVPRPDRSEAAKEAA